MQIKKSLSNIIISFVVLIAGQLFDGNLSGAEKPSKILQQIDTISKNITTSFIENSKDSLAQDSLINNSHGHDHEHSHDSLKTEGNIDDPIFSTAKDSLIEDFRAGRKMIYYYGGTNVKYGDFELTADYIAYDLDKGTVFAKGYPDINGEIKGAPVMKQGEATYEVESVYYNFKSGKAKIKNMITQEGEGYLHGTYIKKMPDNSFNISKGKYTTCDHDHPHFYLQMTAAKVIASPDGTQKTVFGPAYVVLEDVPTPFALPFGFVPELGSQRSSGILIPSYGEEISRGFFLRGLGYYFVFGQHFDLSATTDIYTLGSWALQLNSRYNKRYKYNGNLALSYSHDVTGEKNSPDYNESSNFSFQWSHSQDSKARPGTTFRASVNLSSPSNNIYNTTSIEQGLQTQTSSSISYGKTWTGTPFSLSVNALHSQNSRDSSYSVTLPNLTFTVNRIYPFKKKERVGKEKFYESFAFNYNTTFANRISFQVKEINEPDFLKNMQNGMKHNFSITLPSFTIANYIQASPSISYGMNWYFSDSEKMYNQEEQRVETIVSDPFSTFGVTQDYSGGISFNTRLYGMFNFGKNRRIEAIRHMVTPSLSLSYRPELGTEANGYTTLSYIDANGTQFVVPYNKYESQINSPPSMGESASMSFSLNNNLEAKVRDRQDTTSKGVKKIKLIDQLNFSGSYNFLADSLNLSNISVNMSTTVFGKLGISASANLDPYAINEYGKKIGTYNIVQEGGLSLFRLVSANFSTAYSFSGKGQSKMGSDYKSGGESSSSTSQSQSTMYHRVYYHPITGEYIPSGWVYYMPPNVPWSMNFNYNYSYNRSYSYANDELIVKNNHLQTLGFSGQIRLSEQLNMNLSTNVDLMKMKISTTQLSATYDLHCFQISVSYIPNGQWASWSFRINAKASALADLLQYKKNASYWDSRSGY